MSTPIDTRIRHGIIEALQIAGKPEGPLAGRSFVVKDLFDVKGTTTGAGNPQWRLSHSPASRHAPCLSTLLNAGADLSGKSLTDEFACSLDGINEHFPIPLNPLYPERIPGGSSSGSASCVAAGIVDFALGTDTVGSTRVPAAYCGIYGFRPSHGIVPLDGVQPLGPSFDTVGWFSRTAELLERVGSVLLDGSPAAGFSRLKVLESAFDLVDREFREELCVKAARSADLFESRQSLLLEIDMLDTWSQLFALIRSFEAWQIYGDWLSQNSASVSDTILARLSPGASVEKRDVDVGRIRIASACDFFDRILVDNSILCLPTIWQIPPLLRADENELSHNRKQNIRLNIIATICGLPQLTVPVTISRAVVAGLSFIGPRGSDLQLLALARNLEAEKVCASPLAERNEIT